MVKAFVGKGMLLVGEAESPVFYDMVQVRTRSGSVMEGTIMGDTETVRTAFLTAEHRLRLDDGEVLRILMLNASAEGVSQVRAIA